MNKIDGKLGSIEQNYIPEIQTTHLTEEVVIENSNKMRHLVSEETHRVVLRTSYQNLAVVPAYNNLI